MAVDGIGDWIEADLEPTAPSVHLSEYRFVARQPIVDQMGEIFGYEFLSRPGPQNHFSGDPEVATRTMAENWLVEGLEALTGGFPCFLNCTREALVNGSVMLYPKGRTVLELLETVEPDKEVVDACRTLQRMGYGIALDDFQFSEKMEPLVELADYVKLDFQLSESRRRETLRQLDGSGVRLVAEKVETEEELKIAFDEGFELFQGYLFGRPRVFSKDKTLPSGLRSSRHDFVLTRMGARRIPIGDN